MTELTIIKTGGQILDDPQKLETFLAGFAQYKNPKILVHGGGKLASDLSKRLGITPQMVDGRRITTDEDLAIVTMVYAGLLNKRIVAKLQAADCPALGLTGADAGLITAVKRPVSEVDYGWVGDVEEVNASALIHLIENGLTPVFCALTHDGKGNLLNTNADTIASELAQALSHHYSTRLIYCFEKKGVLDNIDDEHSVIPNLDQATYQKLKESGKIHSGMLPKLDNCFAALTHNVKEVLIGDWQLSGNPDGCTRLTL